MMSRSSSSPIRRACSRWWPGLLIVLLPGCLAHWGDESSEKGASPMTDRRAVDTAEAFFQKNAGEAPTARFPWYDAETGRLVPIPMPTEEPPPQRKESGSFQFPLSSLSWFAWVILGLLIAGVLILLFVFLRALLRYYLSEEEDTAQEVQDQRRRIEALPLEAREKEDDLLSAAMNARKRGDLREALIFYFSYVLSQLDRHHLVHLHKGKTNYEYLAELQSVPAMQALYLRVMALFEKTYFGEHTVIPTEFEKIWQERETFQIILSEHDPHSNRQNPGAPFPHTTVRGVLLLAAVSLALLHCPGCGSGALHWGPLFYEYHPPPFIDRSVNGYLVFREMCRAADHTCRDASRLTPALDHFDCIVWTCRSGLPPSEESRRWMEDWLREKPNRTLLFVPRSYHADPDYLDAIEEKLTPREIADSRFPQERHDSRRRLRDVVDAPWARDVTSIEFEAIEEIENALNEEDWQDREIEVEIPEEEENDAATNEGPIDGGWYVLEKRDEPLSVAELSGEPKWAGNIDPQNTRLKLYQKFTPKEAETLLAAQDDAVLVARREIGESQLLLVPGGMFLVNMQLIPESHRKLAGRLISEFGSAEQRILFLNAGHHPPRGDQTESGYDMPLGMHLLTIWPTSLILWQFLVLGILLCFWKWPAFGRRRRLPDPPLADFGEHIDAIAQLQRSTKRSGYPREQWMRYWNLVQPHSRPPDSTSGDEA